jgi:large conductance mechanosensitive channel
MRIRDAVEAKPLKPPAKPKNLLEEFKLFLKQYKVLGLAVAFIMGIYLGDLVKALATDLIMPIVGIFTPGIQWNAIVFVVGTSQFFVGDFIGKLITFIIIALVIFLIVKLATRMGIE